MKRKQPSTFEESAGLRQILLAYVPKEVGDALSVVTSYIYDQALAEGELPSGPGVGVGYVAREARALAADLRYIELRLEALVEAGVQTSLTAEELKILSLVETGLEHLRRAREEMAQDAPEGPGAGESDEDGRYEDEDG